ncbi:MAG: glycosyltransferase [Hyphomicrobiales bacterium]
MTNLGVCAFQPAQRHTLQQTLNAVDRWVAHQVPAQEKATSARMLKVLHVITGLGFGGAERMLTRVVCTSQKAAAHDHVVVSLMDHGHFGQQLVEAGAKLHTIGLERGRAGPTSLLSLCRIIRQHRPDVVMSWLYHADFLATLAAALAGNPPLIWNLRCSDIDLSRYGRSTRFVVRALSLISKRPAAVGYNSEAGRTAHANLGYRPKLWCALPNGFDLEEWYPSDTERRSVREELGVASDAFVFMIAARYDPQKDHTNLLSAAATAIRSVPDMHFVLLGGGTKRLTIPQKLQGHVSVLGARGDVQRLLRGADAGVSASAYGEGLPNSIGEAMATGLPCVGTDVGDTARLIANTGMIVVPRDPKGLSEALIKLAQLNPAERRRLGSAARERIGKHFSMKSALKAYETVWEKLAHNSNKATTNS